MNRNLGLNLNLNLNMNLLGQNKEIFISHAWGKDGLDRDNHLRCKELCDKLISSGYKVWFDHYDMYGNIDSAIMKGINNCKIFIVCLTERYCNKINNAVNHQTPNDNCYKEWNYSLFKQKIIIPIVMEPNMHNIFNRCEGVIQMYLNSTMYIDMANSIDDEFPVLTKTLRKFDVYTKDQRKFYANKTNNSFDNIVQRLNVIKALSLSPRKIGDRSRSPSNPSSPSSSNSPNSPKSPPTPNSLPKSPNSSPLSFRPPNFTRIFNNSIVRPSSPLVIRPPLSKSASRQKNIRSFIKI